MSLERILATAASGMEAQKFRMATTASNLANAETTAARPEDVYKAKKPVFEAIQGDVMSMLDGAGQAPGIRVTDIVELNDAPLRRYDPGHPNSNADGFVFSPAVNVMTEMADMIAASRAYEVNVEVMKDARELSQQLLRMGQQQ